MITQNERCNASLTKENLFPKTIHIFGGIWQHFIYEKFDRSRSVIFFWNLIGWYFNDIFYAWIISFGRIWKNNNPKTLWTRNSMPKNANYCLWCERRWNEAKDEIILTSSETWLVERTLEAFLQLLWLSLGQFMRLDKDIMQDPFHKIFPVTKCKIK